MSPRSVFEEISLYRATVHILSAAVLAPPYQYTVQRSDIHISLKIFEEGGKPNSCCGSHRIIQVDAAHWWWLRRDPPPI